MNSNNSKELDPEAKNKNELLRTLSRKWNVRAIDLSERIIDPAIVKMLPLELVREKIMVPFARENGTLLLAMRDPRDTNLLKEIESAHSFKVIPYLALSEDIYRALAKIYGRNEFNETAMTQVPLDDSMNHKSLTGELDNIALKLTENIVTDLNLDSDSCPIELDKSHEVEEIIQTDSSAPEVEKVTHLIILEAIRLNASDIHIEPLDSRLRIRYRVDGELRESSFKVPLTFKNAVISKLKILGEMNIAERRIPQDGRITLKVKGNPYEFRINTVPTVLGESAVLRLLNRSGAKLGLHQLGFSLETQKTFLKSLQKPFGLILVCGPTGSGKSYTLMAALTAIHNPKEKILTAENPVEYNLEGIMQVQISPDLSLGHGRKFDFSAALRSFLRQDPDIIMVGEIRDEDTGRVACEAALTGHRVLSTLHTNDATSAVVRLSEMGIEPYLVGSTLECVLSQRLVRTLCNNCKVPDPNPPAELLRLLEETKIGCGCTTFMKPKGCPACRNEGLIGRTAVGEIFVMNETLRSLCKPGVKNSELRDAALRLGMRSLLEEGLLKVTKGITTFEELMGVAK